jgi:diguanylate cyclase
VTTPVLNAPYILLVEDNPGDAFLTHTLLDEAAEPGAPTPVRWVQTVEAAIQTLETAPGCHAVLLDLGLPDGQGLATLRTIGPYAEDCPTIVLTGDASERVGMEAVMAGAQDFLVKGSFDAPMLKRCIAFASHRKQVERALVARALHDELTGLPRRALLMDRLQEALKRFDRRAAESALLFIDLDRFKHINDSWGHAAGDAVLKAVGARLAKGLRASDTVARLGGDEFVVLLPALTVPPNAEAIARKLLEALERPIEFEGRILQVSASVGIVHFHDASETAEALMHRADTAMYAAKAAGRGQVYRP